MKKLYKKYRIDSLRMPEWDYSRNGKYFVTLCVEGMKRILGEVVDQKMVLSDFGKIVEEQWFRSFEIRKELFYDEFIIMPNHIHAILIINHRHIKKELIKNDLVNKEIISEIQSPDFLVDEFKLSRQPKSISSFLAGFKSACYSPIDDLIDIHNDKAIEIANVVNSRFNKKEYTINQLPMDPRKFYKKYNRKNKIWQPNYHDHIIRDEFDFKRIKNYIINNPKKWNEDIFRNPNH